MPTAAAIVAGFIPEQFIESDDPTLKADFRIVVKFLLVGAAVVSVIFAYLLAEELTRVIVTVETFIEAVPLVGASCVALGGWTNENQHLST